jgi:mannose-1-phosphate guanylyltransferase / mannose-6-phosphate isomerase
MALIVPVIMCGGSGTRLWPISRSESPKQFQRIDSASSTTFFQDTVRRHTSALYDMPMVLTNGKHAPIVINQLTEIQQPAEIIAEPASRNTAPAIAVAALQALRRGPDTILLTVPSDHLISDRFNMVVENALHAAEEGYIVVFGINPTYAETGYGYIIDGGHMNGFKSINSVAKFVEKPNFDVASALIERGDAYWASGIALFRASVMIEEFDKHAPDILAKARASITTGITDRRIFKLGALEYSQARNESCEFAVIEKSNRIVLAPADVEWDDVGAWRAFHRIGTKSDAGNVTSGDVVLVDTHNSYIRSESRLVTVIGLDDLVVVDTADALLITSMSGAQSVKKVVEKLNSLGRPEAMRHVLRVEEWGSSNLMAQGQQFSLRHIHVQTDMAVTLGGNASMASVISIVEGQAHILNGIQMLSLSAGSTLSFDPGETVILHNAGSGSLHAMEMLVNRDQVALRVPIVAVTELGAGAPSVRGLEVGSFGNVTSTELNLSAHAALGN